MTFASEEVRTHFHALPTQTQVDWSDFEESLARQGRGLRIESVYVSGGTLEVGVRIYEKLK